MTNHAAQTGLEAAGMADLEVATQNLALWTAGLAALEALQSATIPFIVLKSLPQVEELYGDAAGRPTTDVDLLVKASDMSRSISTLCAAGGNLVLREAYESLSRRIGSDEASLCQPWLFEFRLGRVTVTVDLHADAGPPAWQAHAMTGAVWKRAGVETMDALTFQVLSPEDRLLLLSCQFLAHGMDEHHQRDVSLILESSQSLDWRYVWERAGVEGIAGTVRLTLWSLHHSEFPSYGAAGIDRKPRLRERAAVRLYEERTRRRTLDNRTLCLIECLVCDRWADGLGVLRRAVVPSRMDVVFLYRISDRLPTWPEHMGALLGIYRRRLGRLVGAGKDR